MRYASQNRKGRFLSVLTRVRRKRGKKKGKLLFRRRLLTGGTGGKKESKYIFFVEGREREGKKS